MLILCINIDLKSIYLYIYSKNFKHKTKRIKTKLYEKIIICKIKICTTTKKKLIKCQLLKLTEEMQIKLVGVVGDM